MTYNNYYEYEWDSYYCYPNCFTLKNKLNIKDEDLLEEAERQITAVRKTFAPGAGKFGIIE